jgi:ABC-type polysaccharide/polyol phosphate export permease
LVLFAGLLPWGFVSGVLLDAAIVLGDNGPLLRKVVCPPEVFPAVTVFSHLVHHLLALPILLVAIAVAAGNGLVRFPWTVVLLPIVLLIWLLAVGGLALAVAALAVHFRDLKDLLHNLLNIFFFATPIIYPLEMIRVPVLKRLIQANPATPLIQLYRDVVLLGRLPSLAAWGWAAGVAAVFWLLGSWIFSRLRETIAETV